MASPPGAGNYALTLNVERGTLNNETVIYLLRQIRQRAILRGARFKKRTEDGRLRTAFEEEGAT